MNFVAGSTGFSGFFVFWIMLVIAVVIGVFAWQVYRRQYKYRPPRNAERISLKGKLLMARSHRKYYKGSLLEDQAFWLVRDEETGKKTPVFVNCAQQQFVRARGEFQIRERINIVGSYIEATFDSDAAMQILSAAGESRAGYGTRTTGRILAAESVTKLKKAFVSSGDRPASTERILSEIKDDPRGPFQQLFSRLEHAVKARLNEVYPEGAELIEKMTISQAYELGVEKDIFPSRYMEDVEDLRRTRNRITHPEDGKEVEDSEVLEITHIGAQLLVEISRKK